MVKNWAFIYCSPGFNAVTHTRVVESEQCRVTLVGVDVSERDMVMEIAKTLLAEGCQMIELCGGFGPLYIAKVKEATGYKIPVGSTMYGPEDRRPMLEMTGA